jgi:hypothetical protein
MCGETFRTVGLLSSNELARGQTYLQRDGAAAILITRCIVVADHEPERRD